MPEKDLPLLTAGQRLREARLARGLSLADVAAQTRIAPEILADIEADEAPDQLAPLYVRSFVRTYAVAVGLGPEEVLSLHDRSAGAAPTAEPVWEEEVQVRKVGSVVNVGGWVKWLLLVLLAGVAVVFAARALDRGGGDRGAAARRGGSGGLAPAGVEQPAAGGAQDMGQGSRGDRAAGGADTLPPAEAAGAGGGTAGAAADSGSPGR